MPGSEIHAQLLENLIDGSRCAGPRGRRRRSRTLFVCWAACCCGRAALAAGATPRCCCSPASPCSRAAGLRGVSLRSRCCSTRPRPRLASLLFFGVLLVLTLAESDAATQRAASAWCSREREDSARIAGELKAAQRIQTAHAAARRLCCGDDRASNRRPRWSRRGRSAATSTTISCSTRSACSSWWATSRARGCRRASSWRSARRCTRARCCARTTPTSAHHVARPTPRSRATTRQMLFVTAFAGDPRSRHGELEYCNAGHENPYWLHAARARSAPHRGRRRPAAVRRDRLRLRRARAARCEPGELVCMVTDGVTEAHEPRGRAVRQARAARRLLALLRARDRPPPREVRRGAAADVDAFAAGAEPADDLTILALRWRGPGAATGACGRSVNARRCRRAGCAARDHVVGRGDDRARACRGRPRRCSPARCRAPPVPSRTTSARFARQRVVEASLPDGIGVADDEHVGHRPLGDLGEHAHRRFAFELR